MVGGHYFFSCLLRAVRHEIMLGVQTDLSMSHFSAFQSMSLFNLQRRWANIQETSRGKAGTHLLLYNFFQAYQPDHPSVVKCSDECFYSDLTAFRIRDRYSKAYSSLSLWKVWPCRLVSRLKSTFLESFFLRKISHLPKGPHPVAFGRKTPFTCNIYEKYN